MDVLKDLRVGVVTKGQKQLGVPLKEIEQGLPNKIINQIKPTYLKLCNETFVEKMSSWRTTAQQVANQFLAASGKQISRKTVARRLRGGGLYARRPVVCVPLTRQHSTARLQWCREHHNWTEQYWACVLFSDESRFSLSSEL
ncbi:HTH_Tnp_Tc3_2 domain-containing protein [Trichonephila clavipes]|uniref:HTH_Tnp_Tc3_2 domain-containing protein n=1 Tax=Trichonephila clavipes TaxID=2585209 RepID=A0A8X6V4E7_TRICX|nr:HTH_Tnp_Tc3_2 domain-containing protein [Trichonephila clavipes]